MQSGDVVLGNTLTRAASAAYRRLPFGIDTRRKIKSLVLGAVTRGRKPFEYGWRGMKVTLDPAQSMDLRLYFDGDYEAPTLAAVKRLAPAGGNVIDIGANVGFVTLWASQCVGPGGTVIAVEPSAWALQRLKNNAALNDMRNIVPVHAAAGAAPGEAEMFVINGYRVDDKITNTRETVTFVTIDDLVAQHGLDRVDLIKSDTDGYELGVLNGASATIQRFKPAIVFEMYPSAIERAGGSPNDLIAFLDGLGYHLVDEHFQPVEPHAFTARIKPNESANLIALP